MTSPKRGERWPRREAAKTGTATPGRSKPRTSPAASRVRSVFLDRGRHRIVVAHPLHDPFLVDAPQEAVADDGLAAADDEHDVHEHRRLRFLVDDPQVERTALLLERVEILDRPFLGA